MKSNVLSTLTLVSLVQLKALAANYTLLKDHSGTAFFNDWDFYGNYDNLTNGALLVLLPVFLRILSAVCRVQAT